MYRKSDENEDVTLLIRESVVLTFINNQQDVIKRTENNICKSFSN